MEERRRVGRLGTNREDLARLAMIAGLARVIFFSTYMEVG
jgi:hypothetical protein